MTLSWSGGRRVLREALGRFGCYASTWDLAFENILYRRLSLGILGLSVCVLNEGRIERLRAEVLIPAGVQNAEPAGDARHGADSRRRPRRRVQLRNCANRADYCGARSAHGGTDGFWEGAAGTGGIHESDQSSRVCGGRFVHAWRAQGFTVGSRGKGPRIHRWTTISDGEHSQARERFSGP